MTHLVADLRIGASFASGEFDPDPPAWMRLLSYGLALTRAAAPLIPSAAALAAAALVLMGATARQDAELKGSLAVTLRGSGAAPFGITSAIFGGTNIGYNLGRLLQAAKGGGLESLEELDFQQVLPADESYQGTMDFELRAKGRNRWELERLKVRYDFVDRTRLEYDQASMVDVMNDSGTVTFADGRWQSPGNWQPEADPKISLETFRAESKAQCENPGVNRTLLKAKALISDTSDWVTCYDLEIFALHPMRPTGESHWKSPMGEVSLKARDGVLEFSGDSGLDFPSSLPLPPGTPDATHQQIETMLKMGQMTQDFLMRGMGEIELNTDMTWERSYRGVLVDRSVVSDQTYVILSGAQARERLVLPLYSVKADPGGPYKVTRAGTVRLDGSKSRGRNLEYEWHFGPQGPAAESGNEGATKKDKRAEVLLLETMEVILKVTDTKTGVEDVASTITTVVERDWETAFSHRSNWSVTPNAWQSSWGDPTGYPTGTALTPEEKRNNPELGEGCRKSDVYQAGENWCAAAHPGTNYPSAERVGIIHPHGKHYGTWLDHGYSMGLVDDPNGPFHGWSYVTEQELSVERDGVFNPTLRPNGPPPPGTSENFSQANTRLGKNPAAFRGGVERHEGLGSGTRDGGHSLIFRQILDQTDPAKEIEKLYAETKRKLQRAADQVINDLDTKMATDSKKLDTDPDNQTNWKGKYYVYDREKDEWCLVSDQT